MKKSVSHLCSGTGRSIQSSHDHASYCRYKQIDWAGGFLHHVGQSFGKKCFAILPFCHIASTLLQHRQVVKPSSKERFNTKIYEERKRKKSPSPSHHLWLCSTNKLGFGPEFLGRVRLVTSVASLLGVAIFNTYLKEVPLRKLFLWTTLIGAALGSTQVRRIRREGGCKG